MAHSSQRPFLVASPIHILTSKSSSAVFATGDRIHGGRRHPGLGGRRRRLSPFNQALAGRSGLPRALGSCRRKAVPSAFFCYLIGRTTKPSLPRYGPRPRSIARRSFRLRSVWRSSVPCGKASTSPTPSTCSGSILATRRISRCTTTMAGHTGGRRGLDGNEFDFAADVAPHACLRIAAVP
jgi:hypothetical protein